MNNKTQKNYASGKTISHLLQLQNNEVLDKKQVNKKQFC